jgi:pimeloyl-ACP methyl ester carboxylesterase
MPADTLTTYPSNRPFDAAYGAAKDIASFVSCTIRPPCAPPIENVPKGDGHAVIVIPGFLTGDWATKGLINWLKAIGYDAVGWGAGMNWGPSSSAIERCEVLLDEAVERTGRKATLIGRSLGGLYVRELAKDEPDKVVRVITLGTPVKFPIATPLSPVAQMLAGNFDPEFVKRRTDLLRNPPVPVTAFYSRKDGIVPWRSCLVEEGPMAENIEVDSPHTIMGSNPTAMRFIAERLVT